MTEPMALAMVAEMLDVAYRWEFRDCDDLAATVRAADAILERCEGLISRVHQDCTEPSGWCLTCGILADIRKIRGGGGQ